jgi:hypothetical protein
MLTPDRVDNQTVVFYLELPREKVVLLQALFESYEGVATVRTLNLEQCLVAVMTTPSMERTCSLLLSSVSELLQWRPVFGRPQEAEHEIVQGDFRKEKGASC